MCWYIICDCRRKKYYIHLGKLQYSSLYIIKLKDLFNNSLNGLNESLFFQKKGDVPFFYILSWNIKKISKFYNKDSI